MTEERIKELARKTLIGLGECTMEGELSLLRHLIRTVAAEAREEGRKEGIEELCNSLSWQQRHGTSGRVALINEAEAERLKENL